jgi:glutamyl-Q tRNA(Asp) synthetase
MGLVSRFAPSPTGLLHLGHAWSALQAHDLAKRHGGRFLLRIEDIDAARCRADHVQAIQQDMRWLGLDWDGDVIVQSQRMEHYARALETLSVRGLTYRCWCTRAEVAASAGAPQGDEGPLYPGTCKGRSDPGDGRAYCVRLDVARALSVTGPLFWDDARAGTVAARPETLGDVVLARKDVATSYHLSVTVDDAAQGVSDVVRGQDLFSATHVHRLLQALLALPVPRYHHHGLIIGADGARLAKRKQAPTLQSLRAGGKDPQDLMEGMRAGRFPFGFGLVQA